MASKKPKPPRLADLSRRLPTSEELTSIVNETAHMDSRGAALVFVALLDSMLELCLRTRFVQLEQKRFEALFRSSTAPLAHFASKIELAYALGIFDEDFRVHADRIRSIRNVFAHAMIPIDFDHPEIAAECLKLIPDNLMNAKFQPETGSAKERFLTVCHLILIHLMTQLRENVRPQAAPAPASQPHDQDG